MNNPDFFSFINLITSLLLTELSPPQGLPVSKPKDTRLYYALLDKSIVDLDDFAKSYKAEEIPFPESIGIHLGLNYNSTAVLSSKVYGTKNILWTRFSWPC